MVIQFEKTLLSDDIFEKKFVCDLKACKGICCVEGESGAPLEKDELEILENIFEEVKPFLRSEGIEAIEKQGKYIIDSDEEYVTPLINGKECAYTLFEKDGTAACGMEKAYLAGKTNFQKPISCHLYPIRVTKLSNGTEALNYSRWDICKAACTLGSKLNVKVYQFLENALVRKYGKKWYDELKEIDRALQKVKK
ncbi:hypothetical protein FLAV_02619 [Flavobacteriales bacterium]|nr:hypothetical protein [Flavobacteriales bacterium]CAG0996344.1 hypothetical protein FLAV_02619 [Flavobacteriales bacterium]